MRKAAANKKDPLLRGLHMQARARLQIFLWTQPMASGLLLLVEGLLLLNWLSRPCAAAQRRSLWCRGGSCAFGHLTVMYPLLAEYADALSKASGARLNGSRSAGKQGKAAASAHTWRQSFGEQSWKVSRGLIALAYMLCHRLPYCIR